jgi:uncharacterized protein YndB with AHSA1/START domain
MAAVTFEVVHRFDASAESVWDELIDWRGHAAWVPMTRVAIGAGDPHAVGATFTAWTGPGPLALEDRMRVTTLDWDPGTSSGRCEVDKLGPVLRGTASFTVEPVTGGSLVRWIEDVTVPVVPQLLSPVVAWIGATGFRLGMRRLAALLDRRGAARAA